jgi:TonB family protein
MASADSFCANDQPQNERCGQLRAVHTPAPKLPAADVRGKVSLGDVLVQLSINEDGMVSNAKLIRSSGIPSWDRAILKQAKAWKFSEGKECGVRNLKFSIDINVKISQEEAGDTRK